MLTTVQPLSQLNAPAAWRSIDLISDLHLQAGETQTFAIWQRYMAQTPADALFILGDLFEVWVGDDAVAQQPFLQSCAAVLKDASQRLFVGLMHGNRDFLIGPSFVRDCQAHMLADPIALHFAARTWLLTHGDALCIADHDYQCFRAQVRTDEWHSTFLAKPLAERQKIARDLRDQSESRKRESLTENYADADTALSLKWLENTDAQILIHGHTHRPAEHKLDPNSQGQFRARWVLSDWDTQTQPIRAQVLRIYSNGQHERFDLE